MVVVVGVGVVMVVQPNGNRIEMRLVHFGTYYYYPRRRPHARAALAAELLLLGDARHPHMGYRAGDAAGAPLTALSQDTSRPWPAHVHTLLMSTEPSHKPRALRHGTQRPQTGPRLLSLPRPGSRLPNRTSRLAG